MRLFFIIFFVSLSAYGASNPELQKELEAMAETDQNIRNQITDAGWENPPKDLISKMQRIDSENTERLKEIIKQHSWLTSELVGKSGIDSVFLIIQHSPDTKFKEKMLPFLRQSFLDGDGITGQDVALLTDRVLVNQGKEQIYGTQLNIIDGELIFDPIADKANVDKRRAEMGMPPIEQYKKLVAEAYGLPVK